MKTIDVTHLAEKKREGSVELIDVRTPVEFRELHAEGAKNVPLDSLDPQQICESRNGRSGQPLYVICRSGARGAKAVQKLVDAGVEDAINVEGGTLAWEQAGLPVERGRKAISLERQVRIVAGFLTLLGAVLGFFVNPYFIGLSAFIGAGLMFAGLTDTCGMGMMLAKMPWNQ
jgi:rhodanese-related sulfurtransferase